MSISLVYRYAITLSRNNGKSFYVEITWKYDVINIIFILITRNLLHYNVVLINIKFYGVAPICCHNFYMVPYNENRVVYGSGLIDFSECELCCLFSRSQQLTFSAVFDLSGLLVNRSRLLWGVLQMSPESERLIYWCQVHIVNG